MYYSLMLQRGWMYMKAVEASVFKRGQVKEVLLWYDTSETQEALRIRFRGFEEAVRNIAGQYLELLGKERSEGWGLRARSL